MGDAALSIIAEESDDNLGMKPQIEFRHVLGELSVNRQDPCEILRELISNSYDANAKTIFYSPLEENRGLIFFDDGDGLNTEKRKNGITPWEAFFSIGKSTKNKGDGIGYKCQGSKLCFASSRILVATRNDRNLWHFKIIDNPRNNLDINFDIAPESAQDVGAVIKKFFPTTSAKTALALTELNLILKDVKSTCTLIIIDELDTEQFEKYFACGKHVEESYVYNYIRFCTRQGDARHITNQQGFTANQIQQVSATIGGATLLIFANGKSESVPFGYPYLDTVGSDPDVKLPAEISRLRDGRFYNRAAKSFAIGSSKYSIIMAIDGNRRAHDEYKNLDRKGKTKSGIRLSDHRGMFISVKGIKICKYSELLASIPEYQVLIEGDSANHFLIVLDGDFDLVTNRNSLSKKAFDTLSDPDFIKEIKKFLDTQKNGDRVFSQLLSRLKRESTENLLNEQIEILDAARENLKIRERFRLTDRNKERHLFLSPQPGEEYLVGVLYAALANLIPRKSPYADYWQKVITFSTQGIDSFALRDHTAANPLAKENIDAVEYKFEFHNNGPFNHALAVVNRIVAWQVDLNLNANIRDNYTCFGEIRKSEDNEFEWEIYNIENDEGGVYPDTVKVICLKSLIKATFEDVRFKN